MQEHLQFWPYNRGTVCKRVSAVLAHKECPTINSEG